MRYLLPVALPLAALACLLAAPAQAQTFTVPQCEKQATETDTAVQKYLKLPKAQQTSDADADATEEVTSFDDFCIKAYMCPAFEPWWGEERGTLTDLDNYKGKPDWFAKAFAELRKACKR